MRPTGQRFAFDNSGIADSQASDKVIAKAFNTFDKQLRESDITGSVNNENSADITPDQVSNLKLALAYKI